MDGAPQPRPGQLTQRLPGAARVSRGRDIRKLFRKGKRQRTPVLDVFVLSRAPRSAPCLPSPAPAGLPRIGWVVPKLGHSCVARNLVKRRLKEIARQDVLARLREAGQEVDVLIKAKRKAYGASYGQLKKDLMGAVETACSSR